MKSLTKQQQESYENAKMCYIYKEKFDNEDLSDIIIERNIIMLETIVSIQGNIEVLYIAQNSRYSVPENIPIDFHNGSDDDYNFITEELVEELRKLRTCQAENIEKYVTFTVPIEKEVTRLHKNGEEIAENISYI